MKKNRIHFGSIVSVSGLKGYLKVKPSFSELKYIEDVILIDKKEKAHNCKMNFVRLQKGNMIMKLNNINERTHAESFIGCDLFIEEKLLPPLKKGEYYLNDLKGCTVSGENNKKIGTIKNIKNFGAGDLIEISYKNNKSFYLPLNKENVEKIDIKNKMILVNPIKGIIPTK